MDNSIWRNYDWLYKHYVTDGLSWPQIAKIVGRSDVAVGLAGRQFGIVSRSISEVTKKIDIPDAEIAAEYDSGLSISAIAKKRNLQYTTVRDHLIKYDVKLRTNQEGVRLFVDNNHGEWPRECWANKEWLTEQYGSKSINAIAEMIGWSYTRVHDTMADLGVEFRSNSESMLQQSESISARVKAIWQTEEFRRKMAVAFASHPTISSIQLKLYELLTNLQVQFEPENEKTIISIYSFDCLVPQQGQMSKHLLIECQGDYWHNKVDVVRRDSSKFTYIDRYYPEYELMYIWEHEFKNIDAVLARLRSKLLLGHNCIDFDFSDVMVCRLEASVVKKFLDAYHYIGGKRGGVVYGAMLGDKLIGCVLFTGPTRQTTTSYFKCDRIQELSRLCIDPRYQKKNFASWFIWRCLRLIDAELVVAYADKTAGHNGTVYKAANFVLDHIVPPDYWYLDDLNTPYHKKTIYNRAVRAGLKESEYAEKYGYQKRFGGEKICFVRRLK